MQQSTDVHEPCGCSYIIVKSDGQTRGPFVCHGIDAVYRFLANLPYHEKVMRAELATTTMPVDWCVYIVQQLSHTCNESLVRAVPLQENSRMGWTLEVDL